MIAPRRKPATKTPPKSAVNPLIAKWNGGFALPPFGKIEVRHFKPALEAAFREHNAEIEKIATNRAELQKVLDDTPADIKIAIKNTLDSLDELERHAVRLVERNEEITGHLSKVNLPALVTEVKQLAQRAASAKDPEARKSFSAMNSATPKDGRQGKIAIVTPNAPMRVMLSFVLRVTGAGNHIKFFSNEAEGLRWLESA